MASSRFGAPALERGVAILELLAESPSGLRTEEIAERLRLPRSSAFGLVRALHGLGWLDRDEAGRNLLSLRLFTLGAHAAERFDVQRAAAPHLRELRDRIGLTVHLAVPSGDDRVAYLDKVDGPGIVRFDTYVGKQVDAHLTAVGKALLATLPPERMAEAVGPGPLRRGTDRSPATLDALALQLAEARERGYAVEDEEEVEGVRCVAAAVGGYERPGLAAIGCVGLTRDVPAERIPEIGAEVLRTARAISRQLGAA